MTRRAGWKARLVTTIAAIAVLAGPAAAQDLVSNFGETTVGLDTENDLSVNDFAMPFTTGTNGSGYRLTSISLDFLTGRSRTHDPVYVYLQEDDGNGRPNHSIGSQVATLTRNGGNFEGPVAGVNKYSVWQAQCYPQPPHGGGCTSRASSVHLDANTRYWVYVWAGEDATTAEVEMTHSYNETGATGWTLGNSMLTKPEGTAYSNYATLSLALSMKVEGTTNPEVLVSITDVTVTEGVERTADFVVSLSRKTSGPVQVSYGTFDLFGSLTAGEGSDYEATSGTLTFCPGQTRKTVSVPIIDDARNEGNETFGLALTDLQGATFDTNSGTGTINNAEPLTASFENVPQDHDGSTAFTFNVALPWIG